MVWPADEPHPGDLVSTGVCVLAAIMHRDGGPGRSSHTAFVISAFWFPSAGLIGFLFMLRALVAANFNTIYIYTAEVSFGEGVAYIKVFVCR